MANNNSSKLWIGILVGLVVTAILIWLLSLVFPQIITKLTSLIVGLFVVVTGLFLRRKK